MYSKECFVKAKYHTEKNSGISTEFLHKINADYGVIVSFSIGRYFSQHKMLKRFHLPNEIKSFMDWKGKFVPEHKGKTWFADLVFLVNLTTHLNEFSIHPLGENPLICAASDHNSIQNEMLIMISSSDEKQLYAFW